MIRPICLKSLAFLMRIQELLDARLRILKPFCQVVQKMEEVRLGIYKDCVRQVFKKAVQCLSHFTWTNVTKKGRNYRVFEEHGWIKTEYVTNGELFRMIDMITDTNTITRKRWQPNCETITVLNVYNCEEDGTLSFISKGNRWWGIQWTRQTPNTDSFWFIQVSYPHPTMGPPPLDLVRIVWIKRNVITMLENVETNLLMTIRVIENVSTSPLLYKQFYGTWICQACRTEQSAGSIECTRQNCRTARFGRCQNLNCNRPFESAIQKTCC